MFLKDATNDKQFQKRKDLQFKNKLSPRERACIIYKTKSSDLMGVGAQA